MEILAPLPYVQSYAVPALCKQTLPLSSRGCALLASNRIPRWFTPPPSIWPHSTALPKSNNSLCKLGASYVQFIHDDLIAALWPGTDPIDRSEYRVTGFDKSCPVADQSTAIGRQQDRRVDLIASGAVPTPRIWGLECRPALEPQLFAFMLRFR